MKIKELKHNHSLTDLLKLFLFSILMLAPILAIGVKCAYVVINKNAKDSYSDKMVQSTQNVTSINQFINNEIIDVYKNDVNGTSSSYIYGFKSINIDLAIITGTSVQYNAINFLQDRRVQVRVFDFTNNTGTDLYTISNIDATNHITFTSTGQNYASGGTQVLSNAWQYKYNVYQNQSLDNVFYYAIDEVAQEPLFNWTQNTAIYTGVNAMCTGMEITNPIIPILITYWFLLTCIYVIIDILIKGFTMLTHLIGSKLA